MKNIKPISVGLMTALMTTLASAICLFIVAYSSHSEVNLTLIGLLSIFIFVSTFGIVYYFLEVFIYQRIKPIYKSIFNVKNGLTHLDYGKILENDVIKHVEEDVDIWAKNNRQELESLKNMEKYRREFLGNVSHELRTPIFNVQGYIETLLNGGIDDENINTKYLEKASQNIDRLAEIVDDLNLISDNDNDHLKINLEHFNICTLVQDLFGSLEMSAKEQNITLRFKKNSLTHCKVIADKSKISQVLINLIMNSIKYAKIGGETKIGIYDMEKNVLVEVSDNGIGIEKEHLSRLFERFYRVDSNRSRKMGGSGLGLSIVKHIIDAHNQTINVRSTPNVGSSFTFTLKKG